MHFTPLILLFALCVALGAAAAPDVPRPEHPRPDFLRDNWLNLNGVWQFEIDARADGEARGLTSGHDLAQTIRVPFCPESKLSGIGNRDFMTHVWYRRTFDLPAAMLGKRILLHFGAVDWYARVWVNGRNVGEHRGGYAPFTFDISDAVKPAGNELVVAVVDETRSGKQATGKQAQSQESEGCVYTRTTGIWQTVYLEAAGPSYVREFALTPDAAGGRLLARVWIDGPQQDVSVRLRAYWGGRLVGEETAPANWRGSEAVLKLSKVVLWQPGKGNLYDLTIDVQRGKETLDTVKSYFGLRKLSIVGNRFLINDKPVFQRLVLDQGFYPDGIYTAPTEEALKHDIELSLAAGFNGARLHQKVFEPRLLYWADKLGYIVWGEYPSWGLNLGDAQAVAHAIEEWREVVVRDRNHPSIVGWCPLNETGGDVNVANAEILFATTRTMDPTRPYLDTSGYTHLLPETDVYDCHDYDQNPVTFKMRYEPFSQTGADAWNNFPGDPRSAYRGQPYFVSEYGGIRLKTDRTKGGWGYGETDLQGYLARYKGLTDALLDNPNMFGFCYTQLTDVEQEQNGIYFYDRTSKCDPALIRKINARKAAYETRGPRIRRILWETLVPTSEREAQTWSYTVDAPAGDWLKPAFDAAGWKTGPGGFGSKGTPGAVVGSEWTTSDIWLRRTFQLDSVEFQMAAIRIYHDEDAEVYVNGALVLKVAGFQNSYANIDATAALRKALKPGANTLAVHCRQTQGGQGIDVGIVVGHEEKPAE